jgi:hypothetical protein
MRCHRSRSSLRAGLPLFAAWSLLSAPGCSQRVDLREPPERPGQVHRSESTLSMTAAAVTVTGPGISETGEMDLKIEAVGEEEILAVVDGDATQTRLKIVTERITGTLRVAGQAENHREQTPLHGETIEFVRDGADWQRTLVGKVPTREQADDLKYFPGPESTRDWYPAEPVAPGHRWTVDVSKLRRFFGTSARIDSGQWKKRFEQQIQKDGKPYAKIAEEVEIHGKLKDAKGDLHWDWQATGVSLVPLQTEGIATLQLTGATTLSMTVTEDGRELQVRISGPQTLKIKSSAK